MAARGVSSDGASGARIAELEAGLEARVLELADR